jgi:hypothetical protein
MFEPFPLEEAVLQWVFGRALCDVNGLRMHVLEGGSINSSMIWAVSQEGGSSDRDSRGACFSLELYIAHRLWV